MTSGETRTGAGRIAATLVVGVSCGAFAGNLVGDGLLGLGGSWPTVLWVAGAIGGAALTWATAENTSFPSWRSALGPVVIMILMISCIALLRGLTAYFAAAAVLVVGWAGPRVVASRRNADDS